MYKSSSKNVEASYYGIKWTIFKMYCVLELKMFMKHRYEHRYNSEKYMCVYGIYLYINTSISN